MKMKLQTRAKRAFNALIKIGAPVGNFGCYDEQDSVFTISGEENDNGKVWADYYNEFNLSSLDCDNIDKGIVKILDHYGLSSEWSNPGVIDVYNN